MENLGRTRHYMWSDTVNERDYIADYTKPFLRRQLRKVTSKRLTNLLPKMLVEWLLAVDLFSSVVLCRRRFRNFLLVAQELPVGRQFLSVAGPLDDDTVAGDYEARYPVSADDQPVEVGGLLGGEAVEAQVA